VYLQSLTKGQRCCDAMDSWCDKV